MTPKGLCRAKPRAACVHCGRVRPVVARGLCGRCHRDPAVRAAHPPYKRCGRSADREMTEAEVEELVAGQMCRLPPWWAAEAARQREARYGRTLLCPVRDPRRGN